jgi:hypothetical protein
MDATEIFYRIVKYIIEGVAVAAAAFFVGRQKLKRDEIMAIAITAAIVLIILDTFSAQIGDSTRLGAGVALGAKIVGGIPMIAL